MKRFIRKNILIHVFNLKGSFTYFGTKVFFPSGSTTFKIGYQNGIYEYEVLRMILNFCKDGTYFFDVGTNIGTISVPVLNNLNNIKVLSFEASPNTLPYLNKTHQNSRFKNRWRICEKAVSDNAGHVNFSLADKKNGAFESIADTRRVTSLKTIQVESTTLDIEWEKIGRPEVSVIKFDIEGADLLGLKGAANCIEINKPAILMEWNTENIKAFSFTPADLFQYLNKINYSIYSLPYLVQIRDASELETQQVYCEMYLLKPNN